MSILNGETYPYQGLTSSKQKVLNPVFSATVSKNKTLGLNPPSILK